MKGIVPAGPDVYLAHYEDPSLLAEAGRELLYGDPAIQAAVIDFDRGLTYDEASYPGNLDSLAAYYPSFTELDAVAREWAANNAPGFDIVPLDTNVNDTSFVLHFDDDYQEADTIYPFDTSQEYELKATGPLTFSWRLDYGNPEEPRTFYVARNNTVPTLLAPDGSFLYDAQETLLTQIEQSEAAPIPMIAIKQTVGRMVLFSNTVRPTLHAVDQPKARAVNVLLGQWGIQKLHRKTTQ